MLQDLDQLTARIEQLVQRTRKTNAERDALRARLEQAEYTVRTLRDRCTESDNALAKLQSELDHQNGEVAEQLAASQRAESALRHKVGEQEHANNALQAELGARDSAIDHLRSAAETARDRIDAVLARLPGAPVDDKNGVVSGDSL